jgi:hypothetical protein
MMAFFSSLTTQRQTDFDDKHGILVSMMTPAQENSVMQLTQLRAATFGFP